MKERGKRSPRDSSLRQSGYPQPGMARDFQLGTEASGIKTLLPTVAGRPVRTAVKLKPIKLHQPHLAAREDHPSLGLAVCGGGCSGAVC